MRRIGRDWSGVIYQTPSVLYNMTPILIVICFAVALTRFVSNEWSISIFILESLFAYF